jgi:hypothetical protein
LITDPVSCLISLLDFIDDVMADFTILSTKVGRENNKNSISKPSEFIELQIKNCCPKKSQPDAENVIAHDGGTVPYQEDSAFSFSHQKIRCILAGHWAEVPTAYTNGHR